MEIKNLNLEIDNIEKFVFENNSLPIAICNVNMQVVASNKVMQNLIGYSKDELIGMYMHQFNAPGTLAFDINNVKALLEGKINVYPIERKYLTKDGKIIEGNLLVSKIQIENEYLISGIFIPNTFLKSGQDPYTITKFEMLSTILSVSPDLHYIMDLSNRNYVYKNTDILSFFGYSKNDLNNETEWDFLKSKLDSNSFLIYAKGFKSIFDINEVGDYLDIEYNITCKNGTKKWLRERSTPLVLDDKKKPAVCYTIIQDITEKRVIHEKILDQQLLTEKVGSISPEAIIVFEISNFKTIYSNLKSKMFLGYNEYELSEYFKKELFLKYENEINTLYQKLLTGNEETVIENEIEVKSKNGKNKWLLIKSKVFKFDINFNPIQILSVITDFTDYKNAILKLEISEKTQKGILNAIPYLIFKLDKKGYYTGAIASKMQDEYSPNLNDLIGKSIFDVLPFNIASLIKNKIQKCIEIEEVQRFEFERILNEKIFHLENHITKLNDNEVLVIVRNITERKKLEISIQQKVEELSFSKGELEKYIEKNTELERFAYLVSHDLKEPLRTIKSFADILKKQLNKKQDENARIYLDFINTSAERMSGLIDGILQYSKIETNENTYETFSVDDLIRKVLKDLGASIQEKNAIFSFENLNTIYADELQIRQLFQNLISNSLKFVKENEKPIIIISQITSEENIVFSIKDNGIGIPKEMQNVIFAMFKQLNPRNKYEGQGIGLALCKRIVDRHNGKISIESDGENGTTFKILLPII